MWKRLTILAIAIFMADCVSGQANKDAEGNLRVQRIIE
jgi:hypothetical protein